ncbi:MAG TPA: hypothetical protein PLD59_14210, partial [Tepidisphaeraceae bacterium]|nr:hypothetical protein [Tepidisphaeraceae bacterium]
MSEINIDDTDKLVEMFKIPQGDRDAGWMMDLLNIVPRAALALAEPEVQKGPDGFSYLQLTIPPEEGEFKGYSIAHLLDMCIEKGVGAVILPEAGAAAPHWVFTYGNLLSYKLLGGFDTRPAHAT